MSEFSHLKNKLLAEQVEDEIYHYILDTPLSREPSCPMNLSWAKNLVWAAARCAKP